MEKIKKVLKETIVTIIVYIIVMSNNVIYPYVDKKDSLRVPAGEEQTYKRLRVVIETYEEEEILDVIFDGSGIFPRVLRELGQLLKTPGVLKGIAKHLNIEKLVHIKFIAERKVSNQRIEYIREAGILQFYLPEKQTKTPASAKIALNNLLNSNGFNIDTYIERIRIQKSLARRERERKAEMMKRLDSIYEEVTKNIRNADSFFRAYVANKKPSDLDLFRRAVDRIIESALPLRGLMLSGAEEVMLPKFFSVFHSILNIPGGPFTEEESKAIKREVEFLIGSCAPDGWKDDQTRQLIAEIQPLGLKALSENSILAVQSSPRTEMNSAMHGNRKLEEFFNFNLEFLSYHRGMRMLSVSSELYTGGIFIGVSAGLGPSLTGAIAAHEAAHVMMEATFSKSQLAEGLSTSLHEVTTEAIFMLSFLRQNG
ncbi:MAG: hypothetical protein NTV71_00060, partial [Candidatus Omnitrophica bacterium]|nr:hypothetical protein [Candidatus Omnitrophota bacterium]